MNLLFTVYRRLWLCTVIPGVQGLPSISLCWSLVHKTVWTQLWHHCNASVVVHRDMNSAILPAILHFPCALKANSWALQFAPGSRSTLCGKEQPRPRRDTNEQNPEPWGSNTKLRIQESHQQKAKVRGRNSLWTAEEPVGCWYVIFACQPGSSACWVCLKGCWCAQLALCPQSAPPKAFSDSVRKTWPDSRRAGLLPGNLSAPKSYSSWEPCYCLGAEGCQDGLEQSSEELIKRKQVTVSSHLLKKLVDSLLHWAANDLLCWDESPSSSIIPQQSKITSVRKLIWWH